MNISLINNSVYRAIHESQEGFATTVQNLRRSTNNGCKGFLEREVISRILAVVFPIFSGAMLALKIVAGVIDVGEGLISSMKNKQWNRTIFNSERTAAYFRSIRSDLLGICGLPAFVWNPDLMLKCLRIEKTDTVLPRTTQTTIDGIYDLFEGLDTVFREKGINYTLCGGSLLGSIRHSGIIPWDDDGDIAIDSKDQALLLASTDKLQEKGLKLVKHWVGYKICPIHGDEKETAPVYNPITNQWEEGNVTFPWVDIFPMDHDAQQGKYVISTDFPESKATWPNEFFTDQEWNSISNIAFGHLSLKGISKEFSAKYCTRNYGSNWNSVARQEWDHENERPHERLNTTLINRSYAIHSKIAKTRIDHQAIAVKALETMSDEQMDKQWQLNKIFGNIRFINLDRDQDRLVSLKQQFAAVGLQENEYSCHTACWGHDLPKETWDRMQSNYRQIDTSTPEGKEKLDRQHKGQTGCYMSHYQLIKETALNYDTARKRVWDLQQDSTATPGEIEQAEAEVKKYSSVLILEDDTLLGRIRPEDVKQREGVAGVYSDTMTREGTGRIFYEAMSQLSKDWDMLYLMLIAYEQPQKTDNKYLGKAVGGTSLIAYAVSAHMYQRILEQLQKIEDPVKTFTTVDDEIGALQKNSNCFVISPALALHPGEASVINNIVQGEDPKKKFWQYDWKSFG